MKKKKKLTAKDLRTAFTSKVSHITAQFVGTTVDEAKKLYRQGTSRTGEGGEEPA